MPRLLSLVPGRTETTRRFVSHLVVALDGDDAAVIAVLQAMETFAGPIPVLSRAERIAIAPHIAALPHARSVAVVDAALAKAMAAPETFVRGEHDPVRPRPKVAPVMKRKITDAEPPVPAKRQARHAPLPEQALTKVMSDLLPRHKIAHVLAVVERAEGRQIFVQEFHGPHAGAPGHVARPTDALMLRA